MEFLESIAVGTIYITQKMNNTSYNKNCYFRYGSFFLLLKYFLPYHSLACFQLNYIKL